jgi:hypothetical protein
MISLFPNALTSTATEDDTSVASSISSGNQITGDQIGTSTMAAYSTIQSSGVDQRGTFTLTLAKSTENSCHHFMRKR